MVADLASIIEGDEKYLKNELSSILAVCRSVRPNVILKVIIEAAALTTQQKIFACQIADACGVDFVKTSTGLNPAGGATINDVKLMKQYCGRCMVKAAGGIKTYQTVLDMLNAGAQRIGTSAAVKIMQEFMAVSS
jgi:deoxyribose-phosphate aldolase